MSYANSPFLLFANSLKMNLKNVSSVKVGGDTSIANSGTTVFLPHSRYLRFMPPSETAEEKLERLLKSAFNSDGLARALILESLLNFLRINPTIINHVSKAFKKNPLEFVMELGNINTVKELLNLNATYRPEFRELYLSIVNQLPYNYRSPEMKYRL